jgi:hypothetical protein
MQPALRICVVGLVCATAISCAARGEEAPGSTPAAPEAPSPKMSAGTPGALFAGPQPWNTDVSVLPRSDRSDAILAALTGAGGWGNANVLQVDFQMPVLTADSATPRMRVVGIGDYCYGGPDCDEVPAEMPVPDGANIEGSSDLTCDISGNTDGQGDCHLLVADTDGRRLYEVYQGNRVGDQLTARGLFTWDLDKGYSDTLRGAQCTSADAAGFPIAALTPTADQVAAGDVDHALRFILPNDRMKAGVYVPPATHAGGPENADADAPPYGVNFRLRQDFDDAGLNAGFNAGFNAAQRTIVAALKKYGMYLSDGGEIGLTFADDRTSAATWAELGIDSQSFSSLSVDDFDVVDHGSEVELTYDCVRQP